MPRIGRHRGRANRRVSKAGLERAKPARRSAARRLVSLGSLSVPGLQAWGSGPAGFDVEIERALERILGVEILLPEIAWNAHLEALAAGTADIAAGATRSEARSAFAYFSKPYRSETDVLILRKGAAGRYAFSTIDEMLETFAKQKFRLGVVAG
jgi:ABC-type amino acid transport substrate-binding protein